MTGWERRWLGDLPEWSPIVIMGRGHSGTRILTWVCEHLGVQLGAAPEKYTGDPVDRRFTGRIKRIARRNLGIATPDQVRWWDRLDFASAVRRYRARLAPDGAWGWKFPETYLIAPIVHAVLPRSRYVHLLRDGRDIAFKRHLTDDPERALGRGILRRLDALGEPHHLQAARSWAFQVETFEAFRSAHPDARVLDLRFESLLEQPVATVRRLCRFLDLPLTPAAEAWVAQNLEAGKLRQYRREDPARVREVEAAVGAVLHKWGYGGDGPLRESPWSRADPVPSPDPVSGGC